MSFLSVLGTLNQGARIVTSLKRLSDDAQDLFGNLSDGTDTFPHTGLSQDGVKRQLQRDKVNIEKLQHADVFFAEINRVEPYFDREKAKEINSMLSSVSIVHDGLEVQEDKVGSGYFNWHNGSQSGEIQATFHEFKDGDVLDFLTKVSSQNALSGLLDDVGIGASLRGIEGTLGVANNLVNQAGSISKDLFGTGFNANFDLGGIGALFGGSSSGGGVGSGKGGRIMPSDGTFLLPYQYYFRIRIAHIISDIETNMVYAKTIIEDDYLLEGSPSQEYSTGDERYLQVGATFKPIKSWA